MSSGFRIDDAIGVLLDGGRQRHQDGALWADHTAEALEHTKAGDCGH